MILFRIIHNNYVDTWADIKRTASYRKGARWNSAGVPAFYAALNPQSAMLEVANYVASPKLANQTHTLAVFEVPSSLRLHYLTPTELPKEWYAASKPDTVKACGDKYLTKMSCHGIVVPSVTVNEAIAMHGSNAIREPSYANVVLNTEHVGIDNIKLIDTYTPIYAQAMFTP